MKSKFLLLFLLGCVAFQRGLSAQQQNIFVPRLTAINPVSYTDVIYIGTKDTVLVATYSGRIARQIKGVEKEKVISQLGDEIYVLAYNKYKKQVAASTLENGIVIVDLITGKVLKKLPLKEGWSLRMDYSADGEYLFANDQRGNRYLWNVRQQYIPETLPASMPKGSILAMKEEVVTLVTGAALTTWNVKTQEVVQTQNIALTKLGDVDGEGHLLNINFNECGLYSIAEQQVKFTVKHPSWPRRVESIGGEDAARTYGLAVKDGYFEDPNIQMALTTAKFAGNKIYTASIDRSIRVWDKADGKLLATWTGHDGTVNKLRVNANQTQMVSVDLRGGIRFWELQ